ncbi:hypothetical protein CCHL11_10376 [Colletotrichum chlorophyti]|uniref:Uncharacterized protein n=1 Tax=Colletotrichum chlorophyti TaxID=708187 RepID=A0A1Q8S190_9PEZI|nr:hypothetical protein CCHL11_10376 [Colletotrichum chlorophyti]
MAVTLPSAVRRPWDNPSSQALRTWLPSALLGRLYAARSHYGDFVAYHKRFAYQDTLLNYSYGRLKTLVHFYFYRRGPPATPRYLRQHIAKASINFLLGSAQHRVPGWCQGYRESWRSHDPFLLQERAARIARSLFPLLRVTSCIQT